MAKLFDIIESFKKRQQAPPQPSPAPAQGLPSGEKNPDSIFSMMERLRRPHEFASASYSMPHSTRTSLKKRGGGITDTTV